MTPFSMRPEDEEKRRRQYFGDDQDNGESGREPAQLSREARLLVQNPAPEIAAVGLAGGVGMLGGPVVAAAAAGVTAFGYALYSGEGVGAALVDGAGGTVGGLVGGLLGTWFFPAGVALRPLLAAAVGAAVGSTLAYVVKDRLRSLPTIDIRPDGYPAALPEFRMPDPEALKSYPALYHVPAAVEVFYRKLPEEFRRYWELFGSGDAVLLADAPPALRLNPVTLRRPGISEYADAVTRMNNALSELQTAELRVASEVRATPAISEFGHELIRVAIAGISADAGRVPDDGLSEVGWIVKYLTDRLEETERAVEGIGGRHQRTAELIGGMANAVRGGFAGIPTSGKR